MINKSLPYGVQKKSQLCAFVLIFGDRNKKKTDKRTDRLGIIKFRGEVTPHPTAYQRMGAHNRMTWSGMEGEPILATKGYN